MPERDAAALFTAWLEIDTNRARIRRPHAARDNDANITVIALFTGLRTQGDLPTNATGSSISTGVIADAPMRVGYIANDLPAWRVWALAPRVADVAGSPGVDESARLLAERLHPQPGTGSRSKRELNELCVGRNLTMRPARLLLATTTLFACISAPIARAQYAEAADTIYLGTILTMNDKLPNAEAVAVARRILAVGPRDTVTDRHRAGIPRVIDLQDKTLLPDSSTVTAIISARSASPTR